ncbi:MAG: hypothetical protein ACON4T_09480 [Synechococcus sp.]
MANTCRHGAAEPLGPLQPALLALLSGRPGIGKTTLVQTVKADAQSEGYWSSGVNGKG